MSVIDIGRANVRAGNGTCVYNELIAKFKDRIGGNIPHGLKCSPVVNHGGLSATAL